MRQLNSIGAILMASESYDKINPEEIIIKLEEILAFIKQKKKEGKI
jgi:hypothetical protein